MFEIIKYILLGILQGVTEFLPVSSSAHLTMLHKFLNVNMENDLFFDIVLHLGTLVAVLFFYRKEIYNMIISLFKFFKTYDKNISVKENMYKDKYFKLALFIIIASIPTAIIGLTLKDNVEKLSKNMLIVGGFLIITSILLVLYELKKNSTRDIESLNIIDAIIIGITQGFAVFPGISRSGSTISIAKLLGINKELAANFSFLISIPAILGAFVLHLKDVIKYNIHIDLVVFFIGFLTSFIVGYFSLRFLIWIIKKANLKFFAIYCFTVGIILIIYNQFII